MRARHADSEGRITRDGVDIHYEVYGHGEPAILLLPTWAIAHSRAWKAQIPYLSMHHRVVVFDGRGNGLSGRPTSVDAYRPREYVADAVAVLDAVGVREAIVVGWSFGGHLAAVFAARHPGRALGAVMIAPSLPFGPPNPHVTQERFVRALAPGEPVQGWDRYNRDHWLRDYPDFARFFMERVFNEPHSSKQVEDGVRWAAQTDGPTLVRTILARAPDPDEGPDMYRSIRCPVLVMHGDRDEVIGIGRGRLAAELTGGRFLLLEGAGHGPGARMPAKVNREIRQFAQGLLPDASAASPPQRPLVASASGPAQGKRILYLSSPIGLGHARRDLAIVEALRRHEPGLRVDWLAQDPVTRMLLHAGEAVHPVSRRLLSESRHLESEAGEHALHGFEALRRMDEILVANFMVFQDLVERERYDLVVADEAWEIDHHWHEHPELKCAPLAWFTDFVGYLPMPEGGEREVRLTTDYNLEMIGHVESRPGVRDAAIFVGEPEDIVDSRFGEGLPRIRDWTERHFAFSGYVTGFDPSLAAECEALRDALGYARDERVCIAAVGGSAVGVSLLRRILQAWPEVRRRAPGLRLEVVAGPRIDPSALGAPDGVRVHAFLPRLHLHLAACDLALVQGGLSTCMELTALRKPFVYFPLRSHFEQQFHVRHRLQRHRAGRAMSYEEATPDHLADAIVAGLADPTDYLPVPPDSAERAARVLRGLL